MIYVNARFLTQRLTGVQRFAEQICLQLKEKHKDIVFLSPPGIIRTETAKKLEVKIIGKNNGHLWEQYDLPFFLKNQGDPLLLNLCNTGPILYKNKIITLHDVTYLRYPNSYSLTFKIFYKVMTPILIKRSKHLLTVSEFSRHEISDCYKCPLDKISVIYNAVSDEFSYGNNDGSDYILAVSSPVYHKNFHSLIKAFELLHDNYSINLKLKIVGGVSKSFSASNLSSKLSDEKIQFVGRVDDDELIDLYKNAMAFIFPSYYEGFGIPPLEAQACGCPVVASNTASMPEVLGESALYFDPTNIKDMKEKIYKISYDHDLRNNLKKLGSDNIKRFSWGDSTDKLIDILARYK